MIQGKLHIHKSLNVAKNTDVGCWPRGVQGLSGGRVGSVVPRAVLAAGDAMFVF